VIVNSTASKLDSFVTRRIRYEVGRCDVAERVSSSLQVTLTSDVPAAEQLPDYVVACAQRTPDGPVSDV